MNTSQTPAPQSPPSPPAPEQKGPTSYGALLGMLIIVAAVVLGAWYFLGERTKLLPSGDEAQLNELMNQSTSTDPDAIEADLEAQSPDEFNAELDDAFAEVEASFESQ